MASDMSRTERATPHKRQDERRKGNIFQSKDAVSVLSLLGMILLIRVAGGPILSGMKRVLVDSYSPLATVSRLTALDASNILYRYALSALLMILPISGVAMLLGVILGGVQTRFLFAASLLKPKLSRLNPMGGIKHLFSPKSWIELIKSMIKVVIIGAIIYNEIVGRVLQIRNMPLNTLESGAAWTGNAVFSITVKILMFMVALAAADYFYQWWDYEKRMRMTKQEVREENKRLEGNPEIKSRIKDVQRKMAMMRMMQKVPKADVVIRNPTHFAVALAYDPKKDRAPVVVAKGADQIALTIVRIAQENGVYITENKPLARGLYEAVDIGKPIPEAFYKPVADIIAFIYKLKKRTAG